MLSRIRASGRQFVLFTNGSHMPPEAFADELRRAGLDVLDDELLTPLNSVRFYLQAHNRDCSLLAFVNDSAKEYLEQAGVSLVGDDTSDIGAVFVAHSDAVDFAKLERAARALLNGDSAPDGQLRAVLRGPPRAYLQPRGNVDRCAGQGLRRRAVVVGKPSEAALAAVADRLGQSTEEIAVIGDDLTMDVALGLLGGSRTILVQCGISGGVELDQIPEEERPDAVVEGVAALLDWL